MTNSNFIKNINEFLEYAIAERGTGNHETAHPNYIAIQIAKLAAEIATDAQAAKALREAAKRARKPARIAELMEKAVEIERNMFRTRCPGCGGLSNVTGLFRF